MATASNLDPASPKSQLRRAMGFWDVLLFNIAAVLGPRWIAAAAHNGTSSISLWVLAATFFFLPTALIIIELSTRYPAEGGLYVWSKEAFGDFHGFVAGWAYWIYTFFYFPGLLTASVAMSVYIGGPKYGKLASNPHYLLWASLGLLAVAVGFNLVGLNIGKWLQNAGGVSTYVPLLAMLPAGAVDVRNGVFQGISGGSAILGVAWFGVLAALLVTVGNAGGVGATVAGVARVPFVAGIDCYLPAFFGKIHPRWKTPYIAILIQAGISGVILVFSQYNSTIVEAYQFLVDMAVILYFIPFLYMYAAAIKLAYRPDRSANDQTVLVPGGKVGIWITGTLGFLITLGSMVLAAIPPGYVVSKVVFEGKLIFWTVAFIGFGLVLYFWRRMSILAKTLTFAGLGLSVALIWMVVLPIAERGSAHSLLGRVSLYVLLLTCPPVLVGLRPLFAALPNAVLYGVVAHWLLKKQKTT